MFDSPNLSTLTIFMEKSLYRIVLALQRDMYMYSTCNIHIVTARVVA